jgi:hypothetical protein
MTALGLQVPDGSGSSVVDFALHQILTTKALRSKQGWKAPRVELTVGLQGIKATDR